MTKEERLKRQREIRAQNGNAHTKKYEKTVNGFLMRAYRNMESRVKGITKKSHIWKGKQLLDRKEFYEYRDDPDFQALYRVWQICDYERRMTPSPDRVDPSKGYTKDNIQWVPFYINCKRGAQARKTSPSKIETPLLTS